MNPLPKRLLVLLWVIILGAILSACGGGSTTLTVNSNNDADDGACDSTHCSLREAINKGNTLSGTIKIAFNIGGGGPQTIHPTSALPAVTIPMIIDGTTQPGYATGPLIEIDGSAAGTGAIDGLRLEGGGSTVKGLVINRFNGNGIRISAPGGNKIYSNYIGTDITGTIAMGNQNNGVLVDGDGNHIGGDTSPYQGSPALGWGNVISGNLWSGVVIHSGGKDYVQGNLIGLDVTGTAALGNHGNGVLVNTDLVLIGGMNSGLRNVIADNWIDGVQIVGGWTDQIQGNYIGTDHTGSIDLGNHANGVNLVSSETILVGGSETGARNVISGNQLLGVRIDENSNGVEVYGNYIGTNAAGTAALGNIKSGIAVDGTNHTIGSPDEGKRNLISGNGGSGIAVLSTATGIVIKNNYIGTDVTGMNALGNDVGIEVGIGSGATSVQIGGSVLAPNEGNLISGNGGDGVLLFHGAKVWGNKIGTDATGTGALGNGGNGILVKGAGNQIGGSASGNTIAFNDRNGVAVISESGTATNNAIQVNQIHDNEMLGIAIDEDAVIPNDNLDADSGDNNRQNYPILNSAVADMGAGSTTFEGELHSKPNTTYSVEFFSNASCDPSGFGEGQSMFNKVMLTTDAQGFVAIHEINLSTDFLFGNFFTLTATDPDGNTSEFSNCVPMTEAGKGPAATETPGGMIYKPFVDPAEIFWGRCTPDTVRISVEVVNPPEEISYVLLFARLMNPKTGEKTDWSEGLSMLAAGKNVFYYDLSIYDLVDFNKFEDGVLQYQFVVYNKNQEVLGRSDVYGDVAVRACGRTGPAITATPAGAVK